MRSLAFLFGMLCATQALAGLETLFDATSKDFGNVPYGSVQWHRFTLTNTTSSTIRVNSFRSSCKCATPRVDVKTAAPGEKLFVDVEYNTRTFTGPRSMTITVTFDQPRYESVALRVNGYSRQDVVFNPSQVTFGVVPRGKPIESTLRIDYAGEADFKILEVVPASGVEASVEQVAREPRKASYMLKVKLPAETSIGEIHSAVQLRTNDAKSPTLTVAVTGTVEANLAAAPDRLELGQILMGDKLVKKIMLKGKQPFVLQKVTGQVDGVMVKSTEGPRTAHVIQIEYSPTQTGKVDQEIILETDMKAEQPITVRITAEVVEKK